MADVASKLEIQFRQHPGRDPTQWFYGGGGKGVLKENTFQKYFPDIKKELGLVTKTFQGATLRQSNFPDLFPRKVEMAKSSSSLPAPTSSENKHSYSQKTPSKLVVIQK